MDKNCNILDFRTTVLNILKHIRRKEDEFLSKYGLSNFHAMYIKNLFLYEEMTMNELTTAIGVDKANTTRVIRDLLDKELVLKSNEERKFTIKLSHLGRKIATDFKKNHDRFMEQVYVDFTNEEREQMQKLINKLLLGVQNAISE